MRDLHKTELSLQTNIKLSMTLSSEQQKSCFWERALVFSFFGRGKLYLPKSENVVKYSLDVASEFCIV